MRLVIIYLCSKVVVGDSSKSRLIKSAGVLPSLGAGMGTGMGGGE